MIDSIVTVGMLGPPQDTHRKRLTHIAVLQPFQQKLKPVITYINSPLTGAQMEVEYWTENHGDVPVAMASVRIPLASAVVGQNYAHAGLADIELEKRCAGWLTKIALTVCGFSADEITRFVQNVSTDLLELTWHTPTNSRNAQRNLAKRTREAFKGLLELRGRHDVSVRDVDFREKNNASGLLVTFKTGDAFRQYLKYDQITARTNRGKSKYAVAPEIKERVAELHDAIETHDRNEIILGRDSLMELGLSHPDTWTPTSLRVAIDWFWKKAGLDVVSSFDPAVLGAAARQTLARYEAGEPIEPLSASTFSRHRNGILTAGGPDIDPRAAGLTEKLKSVGRQISYDKRWRLPGEFRDLVLCDATAPAIIEELKQGLEYIRDGVEPDITDKALRNAWLTRWNGYVQVNRLWDTQFGIRRG